MRTTRFPELKYDQIANNAWSFFDAETGAQVGSIYRTKTELLADADRYAREAWGISA